MRILHVATTLGPRNGGAAVACLELCNALSRRGHDVAIFTTTIDVPREWHVVNGRYRTRDGVDVRFFRIVGLEYYWISVGLFRALWKYARSFDVVHIHSLYRFHLPVTAFICRRSHVPYIVKPHGSLDPFLFRRRRIRKWVHELVFDKPAYSRAAAIQYVADEERSLAESTTLIRGLSTKSVVVPSAVVVPEGLTEESLETSDLSIVQAKASLLERYPELVGKTLVLFLGRLNFKKGLDILVKAFSEVRKGFPEAHLLLVGPDNEGYSRTIKSWLDHLGLTDAATFAGMLLGPHKSAAFGISSVFVLPSYTENFGIAIIESMFHRCPVVISNKVNIWREVDSANAGLVVPCDPHATAEAICKVLSSPALSRELSENGYLLATRDFTWDSAAKKMEAVYDSVLKPP